MITMFLRPACYARAIAVMSLFTILPTQACTPAAAADCVEVGTWSVSLGLGVGVRSNPLADTDDIPLLLVPHIHYNGERVFVQNLDLGVILWENDDHQLNLLATPSYDQIFFHRWSPGNFFIDGSAFASTGHFYPGSRDDLTSHGDGQDRELITPEFRPQQAPQFRDRHMAGLAGIEYGWQGDSLDFNLQYLTDFTQIHSGEELRLTLAKHWQRGRHHWIASLGANWQSQEIINYYYGVTFAEANERGTYEGKSAISPLLRLDWNYALNKRWDLRLLASYRRVPDEISNSPIVDDNKIITVFVGGVYHF